MFHNFLDYCLYRVKVKKLDTAIFLTDALLFVVSTVTLVGDWRNLLGQPRANLGILVVLFGALLNFAYEIFKKVLEYRAGEDARHARNVAGDIPMEEISLDTDELENAGFVQVVLSHGTEKLIAFCNPRLDDFLRNGGKMAVHRDYNRERDIACHIRENSDVLLQFLRFQYRSAIFQGQMFFNQKKLCLSSDLYLQPDPKEGATEGSLGNKAEVGIHCGCYYDTYLTNLIPGRVLCSNEDDAILADGRDFLPVVHRRQPDGEEKIWLESISASCLNGEIGISTLGITKDNKLVLWTQNRKAQSSAGLLVPTGSGSADWQDYRRQTRAEAKTLNGAVIYAMQRELWEESCKSRARLLGHAKAEDNPAHVGETKIIGYFRWLNKWGKPEFLGLTKMEEVSGHLRQQRAEVFGKRTENATTVQVLLKTLHSLKETDQNQLSLPLYMGIIALEGLCEAYCTGCGSPKSDCASCGKIPREVFFPAESGKNK